MESPIILSAYCSVYLWYELWIYSNLSRLCENCRNIESWPLSDCMNNWTDGVRDSTSLKYWMRGDISSWFQRKYLSKTNELIEWSSEVGNLNFMSWISVEKNWLTSVDYIERQPKEALYMTFWWLHISAPRHSLSVINWPFFAWTRTTGCCRFIVVGLDDWQLTVAGMGDK